MEARPTAHRVCFATVPHVTAQLQSSSSSMTALRELRHAAGECVICCCCLNESPAIYRHGLTPAERLLVSETQLRMCVFISSETRDSRRRWRGHARRTPGWLMLHILTRQAHVCLHLKGASQLAATQRRATGVSTHWRGGRAQLANRL